MGSIVFQMDVQNQKAKLPPANEVCEGYVFTPVCQSFCSRGEYLGRYTPGQVHPFPLTGTPHWQVHSPRAGTPLGRYPPAVYAGIRSTSGRYASYWNAFLLKFHFYSCHKNQ